MILVEKLRGYLAENSPDILLSLQQDYAVTRWLEDKVYNIMPFAEELIAEGKPQYIIEELSMRELTKELRPSKFLYVRSILEEEFLQTYSRFREMGVLTYEVINMLEACKPVFETLGFTEVNEDDRQLRYAVTGTIYQYLNPAT